MKYNKMLPTVWARSARIVGFLYEIRYKVDAVVLLWYIHVG